MISFISSSVARSSSLKASRPPRSYLLSTKSRKIPVYLQMDCQISQSLGKFLQRSRAMIVAQVWSLLEARNCLFRSKGNSQAALYPPQEWSNAPENPSLRIPERQRQQPGPSGALQPTLQSLPITLASPKSLKATSSLQPKYVGHHTQHLGK